MFTWAELLLMWELGRSYERLRLLDLEEQAAAAVAAEDARYARQQAARRAGKRVGERA